MNALVSFDPTALRQAIQSARRLHRSGAGTVMDVLVRSANGDVHTLAQAMASNAGVAAVWEASQGTPDYSRIRPDDARRAGCVPLRLAGESMPRAGLDDPWDEEALRRAAALFGQVPLVAALTSELRDRWLGTSSGSANEATETPAMPQRDATPVDGAQGPVVEFVDTAIRAAFAQGASDVHFECNRVGVVVKLRQDGVMTSFARMDSVRRAEEVISRIKVLSQLDITERRTPQDGRFRFDLGHARIDLRVSIMPSVFGEDAVLRLLDKAQLRDKADTASLDHLGFDSDNVERLRELAELPHGMLLVTGPTGSGKTTTVYAMLSEINTGYEKIITIEDPVEYELAGVLQIPVNERKGLTFAKGLRSILRHDPDRILVGEIRDAETAEIAVQSALTGHQVFTTVHANSVFDVTGRFRHFGIDMYGFMSSLNGVVAQRLVRRLCRLCASSRPINVREQRWLRDKGMQVPSTVPHAVGCETCHGTGYHGRTVLAEVHSIDDRFRDLVTGNAPVSDQRDHILKSGVRPLGAQGATMVLQGTTTTEEIKRVVGWL